MGSLQVIYKTPSQPAEICQLSIKKASLEKYIGAQYRVIHYELEGNVANAIIPARIQDGQDPLSGPIIILHAIQGGGYHGLTNEEARSWKIALNMIFLELHSSRSHWGRRRKRWQTN